MGVRKVLGKTRWLLLAGVAVLAGLVLAYPPFRLTLLGWLGGEPCYEGRPVSYWRLRFKDWRVGPNPGLETAEERRQREEDEKRPADEFLDVSHAPGKWPVDHRNTRLQQGCTRLRGFKDRLEGHGTCLNPTYGEPGCRLPILEGDPRATPVLVALLNDEDLGVRRLAAAGLGTIGPPARAAFPALLEIADHGTDTYLRGIARTTLLAIDRGAAERAGVVDPFIYWSPQPRLVARSRGCFLLDTPAPFLAEGKILAWDDASQTVTPHELATGKALAPFRGPADCARPLAFSRDGKTAASACTDKTTAKIWRLATGEVTATLQGHADAIECLAFSPDGKALASGSGDTTVKLWDISSGKITVTLSGHTGPVTAVAFSPDGKTLASGGGYKDRTVRVWDVTTGSERAKHQHDPDWGGVLCLAFSRDGKTLASGSMESAVLLVDVVSGKKRADLDDGDESGSLDSVSFSPDGRTIAYVSWDKIFLCDVATGENTAKVLAEPGHVDGASFTPDGRILAVTTGRDGEESRLWEFATIPDGKK